MDAIDLDDRDGNKMASSSGSLVKHDSFFMTPARDDMSAPALADHDTGATPAKVLDCTARIVPVGDYADLTPVKEDLTPVKEDLSPVKEGLARAGTGQRQRHFTFLPSLMKPRETRHAETPKNIVTIGDLPMKAAHDTGGASQSTDTDTTANQPTDTDTTDTQPTDTSAVAAAAAAIDDASCMPPPLPAASSPLAPPPGSGNPKP